MPIGQHRDAFVIVEHAAETAQLLAVERVRQLRNVQARLLPASQAGVA